MEREIRSGNEQSLRAQVNWETDEIICIPFAIRFARVRILWQV